MSKVNYNLLKKLAKRIDLMVFDFDGVFTDNRVLVAQDGTEAVFCSRGDGMGLLMARKAGLKLLVITKEDGKIAAARCRKLGIPCIQGIDHKGAVLEKEARRLKIDLKNIAYMGNDINDLECLEIVGLPVCVADAFPEVKKASLYVTKAYGGKGAIREFCDLVLKAKLINWNLCL